MYKINIEAENLEELIKKINNFFKPYNMYITRHNNKLSGKLKSLKKRKQLKNKFIEIINNNIYIKTRNELALYCDTTTNTIRKYINEITAELRKDGYNTDILKHLL